MPDLKDAQASTEAMWINCNNIHCQHAKKTTAEDLLAALGNVALSYIRKNARCENCGKYEASLTLIAQTPGYTGDDKDFAHLD